MGQLAVALWQISNVPRDSAFHFWLQNHVLPNPEASPIANIVCTAVELRTRLSSEGIWPRINEVIFDPERFDFEMVEQSCFLYETAIHFQKSWESLLKIKVCDNFCYFETMLVAKSPHAFLQATGLCQKCWDRMLSDFVNLKQRHSKSAIRNTDLNFENPCLLFENSRNPSSSHHLEGDGGWWAGMVLGGHGIGRAIVGGKLWREAF